MLRNGEWQSCAVPLIWTEFTADIIEHRVREVTNGERFAVALFTPSHLERLSERDWMNLESHGFPVHLYAERARTGDCPDTKEDTVITEELATGVLPVDGAATEDVSPSLAFEAQQAEKAGEAQDALTQLADQIQPKEARSMGDCYMKRFLAFMRCPHFLPKRACLWTVCRICGEPLMEAR